MGQSKWAPVLGRKLWVSAFRILRLTRAMNGHPLAAHGPEVPWPRNKGMADDEHDRDQPEHRDADPDHAGQQMHAVAFISSGHDLSVWTWSRP